MGCSDLLADNAQNIDTGVRSSWPKVSSMRAALGDGRLTPLIVATIAVQVGGEFAAATPCCSAITLPKAPFRVLESELGKSYISILTEAVGRQNLMRS